MAQWPSLEGLGSVVVVVGGASCHKLNPGYSWLEALKGLLVLRSEVLLHPRVTEAKRRVPILAPRG